MSTRLILGGLVHEMKHFSCQLTFFNRFPLFNPSNSSSFAVIPTSFSIFLLISVFILFYIGLT